MLPKNHRLLSTKLYTVQLIPSHFSSRTFPTSVVASTSRSSSLIPRNSSHGYHTSIVVLKKKSHHNEDNVLSEENDDKKRDLKYEAGAPSKGKKESTEEIYQRFLEDREKFSKENAPQFGGEEKAAKGFFNATNLSQIAAQLTTISNIQKRYRDFVRKAKLISESEHSEGDILNTEELRLLTNEYDKAAEQSQKIRKGPLLDVEPPERQNVEQGGGEEEGTEMKFDADQFLEKLSNGAEKKSRKSKTNIQDLFEENKEHLLRAIGISDESSFLKDLQTIAPELTDELNETTFSDISKKVLEDLEEHERKKGNGKPGEKIDEMDIDPMVDVAKLKEMLKKMSTMREKLTEEKDENDEQKESEQMKELGSKNSRSKRSKKQRSMEDETSIHKKGIHTSQTIADLAVSSAKISDKHVNQANDLPNTEPSPPSTKEGIASTNLNKPITNSIMNTTTVTSTSTPDIPFSANIPTDNNNTTPTTTPISTITTTTTTTTITQNHVTSVKKNVKSHNDLNAQEQQDQQDVVDKLKRKMLKQHNKQLRKTHLKTIEQTSSNLEAKKMDKDLRDMLTGKSQKEAVREVKSLYDQKKEEVQKEEYKKQLQRLGLKERDIPRSIFSSSVFRKDAKAMEKRKTLDGQYAVPVWQKRADSLVANTLRAVMHLDNKNFEFRGINIKNVVVSKDKRSAKVKWENAAPHSMTLREMQTMNTKLNQAAGFFASKVAKRAELKYAPKFKFFFDNEEEQDEIFREYNRMLELSGVGHLTDIGKTYLQESDTEFRTYPIRKKNKSTKPVSKNKRRLLRSNK